MKKLQSLLCIVTMRIKWDNTCKRDSRCSQNPEGRFPSYLPTLQGPKWFVWKQGHQGPHQLRWNQLSALQGLAKGLHLAFKSYWDDFEHTFLSPKRPFPAPLHALILTLHQWHLSSAHPRSLRLPAQTGLGLIDSWTYSPRGRSPLVSKLAVYLPVSPTRLRAIWRQRLWLHSLFNLRYHLYWFPTATLINYNKFSSLNNTNLWSDSSGNQKSKISFTELKSKCQQGCTSSTKGESSPCLFQFLEAAHIPWLTALHHSNLLTSSCFLLSLWSSYKDPSDYTGLTQINQNNLLLQDPSLNYTCKLPSTTSVTYSPVLGIRTRTSLGRRQGDHLAYSTITAPNTQQRGSDHLPHARGHVPCGPKLLRSRIFSAGLGKSRSLDNHPSPHSSQNIPKGPSLHNLKLQISSANLEASHTYISIPPH